MFRNAVDALREENEYLKDKIFRLEVSVTELRNSLQISEFGDKSKTVALKEVVQAIVERLGVRIKKQQAIPERVALEDKELPTYKEPRGVAYVDGDICTFRFDPSPLTCPTFSRADALKSYSAMTPNKKKGK